MKIVADQQRCSGHARCASVAPDVFTLNDDGYIGFDIRDVPAELSARARRGVGACPERALKLVEDDSAA
jgi:ferredoxin